MKKHVWKRERRLCIVDMKFEYILLFCPAPLPQERHQINEKTEKKKKYLFLEQKTENLMSPEISQKEQEKMSSCFLHYNILRNSRHEHSGKFSNSIAPKTNIKRKPNRICIANILFLFVVVMLLQNVSSAVGVSKKYIFWLLLLANENSIFRPISYWTRNITLDVFLISRRMTYFDGIFR